MMNYEPAHTGSTGNLQGRYANYFMVGYNAFEIVIDFGQCYSDVGAAYLHTRIIMSPGYAAALLETLQRSLEQHEEAFAVNPGG